MTFSKVSSWVNALKSQMSCTTLAWNIANCGDRKRKSWNLALSKESTHRFYHSKASTFVTEIHFRLKDTRAT
jgi:hypothetical protein